MRWWRRRSEQDFEEEIRAHIGHETDRLVREGWPPAQARERAERAFGSRAAARDRFRATQPSPGVESVLKDVTLALRGIRREPAFTAAAVATLALGIGLNTAVFSVLYGLVLRPLPLPDADRLVTVHQQFRGLDATGRFGQARLGSGSHSRYVNGTLDMVSYAEHLDYRAGSRTLAGLAAFAAIPLSMDGESPLAVHGLLVSCDYFGVLGAGLALGRAFAREECSRPGSAPVVVLSHGFWERRMGGAASVLGRTLILNRNSFTVIGVAARDFRGTEPWTPDLWLPLTMQPSLASDQLANAELSWLSLIGRLAEGATVDGARQDLTSLARGRDAGYPGRETSVQVYPAALMSGPEGRRTAASAGTVALLVGGVIVLMACLNLMNLLLSRAPSRQRAVRIRLSLGASRRRIVRQLVIESVVLGLLGGVAGLALAWWSPPVLVSWLPIGGLQVDTTPDLRVFGYALLVSVLGVAVFGLVPALETTRVNLAMALRGEGAGARDSGRAASGRLRPDAESPPRRAGAGSGISRRTARLRHWVVGVQLAGSLVLLVISALFVRSMAYAESLDPGYRVAGIYGFRPDLAQQGYDAARAAVYLRELRARVAALPGVESAALALRLPLGYRSTGQFHYDDRAAGDSARTHPIDYAVVTGEYFATLDLPIVRGRAFSTEDVSDVVPAVVSESMVRRFWLAEEAIGRRFHVGSTRYIVTGVARDAHAFSLADPEPVLFYGAAVLDDLPARNADSTPTPPPGLMLVVRQAEGGSVVPAVLRTARDLDANVLVTPESLQDHIQARIGRARTAALFAGVFGLLATLLAVVGVYGAVAYAVSQRRHEIGVRFALGALRRDIVLLVLRQGATPLAAGLGAGFLLAAAASFIARASLLGLAPLDPVAFLGAGAILAAVALLAMARPAARAASIDPATSLRAD